ncbi:unnamed protein product, partial [marine sediment metagenome]
MTSVNPQKPETFVNKKRAIWIYLKNRLRYPLLKN